MNLQIEIWPQVFIRITKTGNVKQILSQEWTPHNMYRKDMTEDDVSQSKEGSPMNVKLDVCEERRDHMIEEQCDEMKNK